LLLYLGVRGKIPQLTHHTLLNTADWKGNFDKVFKRADGRSEVPNPASLYICAPSVTDPSVAPEGHENLFVLVPIAPDPSLGSGGINREGDSAIEAAADQIIEQIADWVQIPDLADRIVVRRTMAANDFASELNAWSGTALGMAHTLMQSAFFRPANQSKKLKNLFYVGHNTIPGIGLPMCLIGAELVIKHLTGDKSTGPLADELLPLPESAWVGIR
jgi:phytoene desaturase